tara:strand:+ start:248 stop:565 length:318 start_codon:yes stop_codon:yes gene_type:complete
MLSPVKIFDAKGNLKEIVTKETIEERHWGFFRTNNHIFAIQGSHPDSQLATKEIVCGVCKITFLTTHARTLYCGRPCADESVKIKSREKLERKRKERRNAKLRKT